MTARRRQSVLLLCAALLGAGPAVGAPAPAAAKGSVVYEDQVFETRIRVAGVELLLNGTGVRQVAWFKGYLAALYLASPASTAAEAVAAAGPKRIHMRMLHEVPAVEFSKAMRKGMLRNTPPEQHAALNARIDRFSATIDAAGRVLAKDVVDLDFDPARGMLMLINGRPRGEPIPGADFYGALLRAFVGERPYDKKMRAGLLGKPES